MNSKQNILSHLKVLTIYTLILATAAGFLLWNMEKGARQLERANFERQINDLKAQK
jgi:hypothetical protein